MQRARTHVSSLHDARCGRTWRAQAGKLGRKSEHRTWISKLVSVLLVSVHIRWGAQCLISRGMLLYIMFVAGAHSARTHLATMRGARLGAKLGFALEAQTWFQFSWCQIGFAGARS